MSADCVKAVKLALENADIAVNFDTAGSLDSAVAYYSKAIGLIDSVVPRMPATHEAAKRLTLHRQAYEERLQVLRPLVQSSERSRALQRRMSRVPFEEIAVSITQQEYENTPSSVVRRPYWQMRVIRHTIKHGGFLTEGVFVPKMVYSQYGAKFFALQAKVAAFEQAVFLVCDRISPLDKPEDSASMREALLQFRGLREDLSHIQTNLSKPFPFIREPEQRDVTQQAAKSNLQRFNAMMSNFGKGVKRAAETSYQRIGSALPGRATESELMHYTDLLAELCSKCQVIDDWYCYLEAERQEKIRAGMPRGSDDIAKLELLLTEHCSISQFMREVVCELMLRDIEQLLNRYLRKSRKSFARALWDEDQPLDM